MDDRRMEEYLKSIDDYVGLLRLLCYVVNDVADQKEGTVDKALVYNKLADAHNLARKFYLHGSTFLYLYRGTKVYDIPESIINFPDSTSIQLIARAAYETFATFYYVFHDGNEAMQNCRYLMWLAGGFIEMQKYVSAAETNYREGLGDKRKFDIVISDLRANPEYQMLEQKQKEDFNKYGKWRFKSWSKIGGNAGLDKALCRELYSHMSSHAHSGYYSLAQVNHWLSNDIFKPPVEALILMKMVLSKYIFLYCRLFEEAKETLNSNPESTKSMEFWIELSKMPRPAA